MNYSKVNWNHLFRLIEYHNISTKGNNAFQLIPISFFSFQPIKTNFLFLQSISQFKSISAVTSHTPNSNKYLTHKLTPSFSFQFLVSSFYTHTSWFKGQQKEMTSFKIKPIMITWTLWENFLQNFFINGGLIWHYNTPLLKSEIDATNYSLSNSPSNQNFPLAHPSFFFKFKRFSESESFFFEKFNLGEGIIFFFSDLTTHLFRFKNLTNSFFFTAGLIDLNQEPWLFDFNLPVSNNSLTAKLFCLKLSLQKKKNFCSNIFFNKMNYWCLIKNKTTSLV